MKKRKKPRIEESVRDILTALGEDPARQGLRATPSRVAQTLRDLTAGYREDVEEIINGALFEVDYSEMVMVKDIIFYSLCVPSKQLVNAVGGAKPAREVCVGDRLWTLDRGRLQKTTVRSVGTRKTRDIVVVRTRAGTIKLTSDHPVMTRRGWEEAAKLRAGDEVEWINPRSLARKSHPPQPGYALGYVLGAIGSDGSVQDGRRISLIVRDKGFARKFAAMLPKAFGGLSPRVETVKVPSGYLKREIPMQRVRIVSRDVAEKVCRWFDIPENGSKSKTKRFRFPKVATSSKDMMQGFLDGYCDGDGHQVNSGGRMIISSNKRFLEDLGRYLQTPVKANGPGTYRAYVSRHWDEGGWYGKHGFRRETEFYVPIDSMRVPVISVRRLPKAKKPHTVYSFKCAPIPSFLVGGHLTHNCEHHMLPFFGKATVAYIPKRRVIGLSKIPKIVQVFARRLQVQERMTGQIAETLSKALKPLGVAVIIEARHLCMEMRGVRSCLSPTVTSSMLGAFRNDPRTRAEFLTLANQGGPR